MINAVVRIMSPDDDDERAFTERVVMYLEPLLTAKNISLLKFEPKSVAELADVLAGLEEKAKVGLRPIIHLDTSADATGWGDVGAARLDSLLAPSSRRACASCARRRLAPGLAHSRALGREFPNAYQGKFFIEQGIGALISGTSTRGVRAILSAERNRWRPRGPP